MQTIETIDRTSLATVAGGLSPGNLMMMQQLSSLTSSLAQSQNSNQGSNLMLFMYLATAMRNGGF